MPTTSSTLGPCLVGTNRASSTSMVTRNGEISEETIRPHELVSGSAATACNCCSIVPGGVGMAITSAIMVPTTMKYPIPTTSIQLPRPDRDGLVRCTVCSFIDCLLLQGRPPNKD